MIPGLAQSAGRVDAYVISEYVYIIHLLFRNL